jgi:hypothetical protein
LRLERPVGQLSARAERESGQQGAAVCTSAISSSKVNSRANKQTANIKKRYSRDTIFFVIFMMQAHEHSLREELAYQINWRIDPAAAEIDADMRARPLSFISRKYPASALMASLFFCYVYTRFLRLCVGRRNPILLSSHIWFINMRADKFIAAA